MKRTIKISIVSIVAVIVFSLWASWFYRTREVTSGFRPVNAFDLYSTTDKLVNAIDRNTAAILAQSLEGSENE